MLILGMLVDAILRCHRIREMFSLKLVESLESKENIKKYLYHIHKIGKGKKVVQL
jgi:hypothetical protein